MAKPNASNLSEGAGKIVGRLTPTRSLLLTIRAGRLTVKKACPLRMYTRPVVQFSWQQLRKARHAMLRVWMVLTSLNDHRN
jgi:hypothetical protein